MINALEIARRNGMRRNRVILRPITPSGVQAQDLYRVLLPVMTAWERGVADRLVPEYARTLAMTSDSIIDLEAIIRFLQDQVAVLIETEVRNGIFRWADNLAAWHFQRFASNLKYATNVDFQTMLGPAGQQKTIQDFLARNTALIRDVSDQTRGRGSDIVFRNLQLRTPARDVAKEIATATGLGRKRALRIASDQTQKLSASLDRQRMLDIGITSFEWDHSGKAHPRPEHLARDGKVFAWDSVVGREDPPGYAPFCGCKARGVLE